MKIQINAPAIIDEFCEANKKNIPNLTQAREFLTKFLNHDFKSLDKPKQIALDVIEFPSFDEAFTRSF